MSDLTTILLNRFQYCHVLDNNTGKLSLCEGAGRIQLESHQELVTGVQNKVRVFDGQFAVVLNPFSAKKGDIQEGEREVRIGSCVFSLHPGERLDGQVCNEYVLTDDDALLLRAEKEAPHPLEDGKVIAAGTELLLKGPRRYIPHKDIRVKEERRSISLAEAEGVYVQDDDTGEVRLIRGSTDFFLEHNESRWDKRLTHEELQALGFEAQEPVAGERVLSATPRSRKRASDAVVLDLEDNEAIYLYDDEDVRVEFGPKTVFFGPNERPKVLFISGGVPVRPNVLRIAKLGLGPDFIRDRLVVRTKDNATLTLEVNFRWRFIVDLGNPEKLFALKDFVGFAAQTLSSEIREEAAQYDFEKFHSEAAALVKGAIFGSAESRIFSSNGLEIFGVDVEGITPKDPEIQAKLADAIKTNVDIYTKRVQEEAELASERRLIEGRAKNEEARKELVELQIENERTLALAKALIEADTAKARAQGEAEAIVIRAEAEREAEEGRLRAVTSVLQSDGGKAYIELERAKALKATDKVVVPTDSKLVLGIDRLIE